MTWHEYFMNIAKEVAKKSKDPSSKVGCVIVSQDNRPISFGYNGWVQDCDESYMTHDRPMKYHLVLHAEMNAIIFAKESLKFSKLYCTHAPCENCLKYMLQAGVREIFFGDFDPMMARGSDDQLMAVQKLLKSFQKPIVCCHFPSSIHYVDRVESELKDRYQRKILDEIK